MTECFMRDLRPNDW